MNAVIDTNVLLVANLAAQQASLECVRECIQRLHAIEENGVIHLDCLHFILDEYKNKLSASQSGVGDKFLKWLFNNIGNPMYCHQHEITPLIELPYFEEFPNDADLLGFDKSDRKFVAVAAVTGLPIWNAVDSDWWHYQEILERNHIHVEFLCPDNFRREVI